MLPTGYIIARLGEPSTWRGIVMFASGALGLTFSPELVSNVVAAGVALSGIIGMFWPDKP